MYKSLLAASGGLLFIKKRVASFFNSHPLILGWADSFCDAKTHPAIEELLHQLHTNRAGWGRFRGHCINWILIGH
jgi:hypothetical protein